MIKEVNFFFNFCVSCLWAYDKLDLTLLSYSQRNSTGNVKRVNKIKKENFFKSIISKRNPSSPSTTTVHSCLGFLSRFGASSQPASPFLARRLSTRRTMLLIGRKPSYTSYVLPCKLRQGTILDTRILLQSGGKKSGRHPLVKASLHLLS